MESPKWVGCRARKRREFGEIPRKSAKQKKWENGKNEKKWEKWETDADMKIFKFSIENDGETHEFGTFLHNQEKWEKWNKNIIEEIKKVDYAFLDATFYSSKEIDNRDISQIPHPFITESQFFFKELNEKERKKVIFIHFNHTNPVLNENSPQTKDVLKSGFRIGKINQVFEL